MSEKSIKYISYIIVAGLFILPVLSLIISSSMFFPFITGKNFFFRIVVEILFFFWVFIAVFDKKYRPKFSPILISLFAVLLFLSVSTIFGEDPYRSFWSNYERMEGLIGHIHLFAYFLILTSVFQTKKIWKYFLGTNLAVGFVVACYGFLQSLGKISVYQSDVRLDATLGNSGYLAIYLIFNIFIALLFFFWNKNTWIRAGLAALIFFELFIVFRTATRGAILGLIGASFLFALLVGVFSENKRVKKTFLLGGAGVVLLVILFIALKDAPFIRDNYVFGRLASISLKETTVESRFTIWGMSMKGLQEYPIMGWGIENYNQVFNKYFEPKLWKQEAWFDRSHNVVFDWLISAGLLGFLAYISIFVFSLLALKKLFKEKKILLFEFATIVSLFVAYFFHNLFVFDNLTSYFMFFSVLGFVHFSSINDRQEEPAKKIKEEDMSIGAYILITFVFCFVIFSIYFANVKPILASNNLLKALGATRGGASADVVLSMYDKVFSYNTFGTGEAREQLAGYANNIAMSGSVSQEDKIKVLNKAIEEMEKQAKEHPKSTRTQTFLANIYLRSGLFEKSIETFERALELSPKKQQILFGMADVYLSTNQLDKAIGVLKTAYELDKNYIAAGANLARVAVSAGQKDYASEIIFEIEEMHGKESVLNKSFLNAFVGLGDYRKVKKVWLRLTEVEPTNPQNYISLAATNLNLGEREEAIKNIQKAMQLAPDFKQQGEYFINEIRAGRNP